LDFGRDACQGGRGGGSGSKKRLKILFLRHWADLIRETRWIRKEAEIARGTGGKRARESLFGEKKGQNSPTGGGESQRATKPYHNGSESGYRNRGQGEEITEWVRGDREKKKFYSEKIVQSRVPESSKRRAGELPRPPPGPQEGVRSRNWDVLAPGERGRKVTTNAL